MTSNEGTLTVNVPGAGAVRADAAFDPDSARFTLLFFDNDHVCGPLSVVPEILEEDERNARTAAALVPALRLETSLGEHAPHAGALTICGRPQSPVLVIGRHRADLATLRALSADDLTMGPGSTEIAEVYLALVLALAHAVEQHPRSAVITDAWAQRQRQLALARFRDALFEFDEETRALRAALVHRLEHPFAQPPHDEEPR